MIPPDVRPRRSRRAASASRRHRPAAGMQVSSTSFADAGTIAAQYANDGADSGGAACGGKGSRRSCPGQPAGRHRSLAIMMWDPDGAGGMGVSHWVAYNVAPEHGQLKEGEGRPTDMASRSARTCAAKPRIAGHARPQATCRTTTRSL